jgi:hypothetical protein
MTIEKKSLISTIKTAKKANAVKEDLSGAATVSSAQKLPTSRKLTTRKLTTRKLTTRKLVTKF